MSQQLEKQELKEKGVATKKILYEQPQRNCIRRDVANSRVANSHAFDCCAKRFFFFTDSQRFLKI